MQSLGNILFMIREKPNMDDFKNGGVFRVPIAVLIQAGEFRLEYSLQNVVKCHISFLATMKNAI